MLIGVHLWFPFLDLHHTGLSRNAKHIAAGVIARRGTLYSSGMRFAVLLIFLCLAAGPATRPVDQFIGSTSEQDAKADEQSRKVLVEVKKFLEVELFELETDHFLIFTNWDKSEHEFLRNAAEGAYRAVAKQFGLAAKDDVLVGKLSLYAFETREQFQKYAHEYDEYPADGMLIGYYSLHSDGSGHLAFVKPQPDPANPNKGNPHVDFSRALVRELTKALLDRYRSGKQLPVWLSEGLAEVVSQGMFPDPQRKYQAHLLSQAGHDYETLFMSDARPVSALAPVQQTLVQMLIDADRGRFFELIRAIKDGEETEAALRGLYRFDYPGMVKAWKLYMAKK